jgi:hypothetical protein
MATMWWKSLSRFQRDLNSADDARLKAMRQWASDHEDAADAPGTGRAPKARRHFRLMRVATEQELARRRQWQVAEAELAEPFEVVLNSPCLRDQVILKGKEYTSSMFSNRLPVGS